MGVMRKHLVQGFAQDTLAVAVNNPHAGAPTQKSLVEKLVDALAGLLRRIPDDVELLWNFFASQYRRRLSGAPLPPGIRGFTSSLPTRIFKWPTATST